MSPHPRHGRGRRTRLAALAAAALLAGACSGATADGDAAGTAHATLRNPEGQVVGEVSLTDTPNGVLVHATLDGVPPGAHAFHIHQVGRCAPDFSAAGGHLGLDDASHGFLVEGGPHAGDLPNVFVPASGQLEVELRAPAARLRQGPHALLDADGAAIVMHAGPDDYRSQPAGAAGGRIACGAVSAAEPGSSEG